MANKVVFKALVAVFIILSVFFMTTAGWAATYYVDATNGKDSNQGTFESTAWKTIAKVKGSRFNPGDQILFKRGEFWREQLIVPSSGSEGNPITFGAYGNGNKPKLLGSVNLTGSSNWQQYASSTWRSAITIPVDVGNLIFNNESSCGKKNSALNSLGSQGDFYYDPAIGYLYVYSTSNPGTYYTTIEAAERNHGILISGRNYLTIQDFDLRYWGAHGIQIDGYSANCDNIIIQRNDISYIGGSFQSGPGSQRYGNGIEQWSNGTNIIVRKNLIKHCYDAALTPQGTAAGNTKRNQEWSYNIISNCHYGIELWTSGAGSSMSAIHFYNNSFYNAGAEWSANQRIPDNSWDNAAHVKMFNSQASATDIQIKNNIFSTSSSNAVQVWTAWTDIANVTFSNNLYYQPSGNMIVYNYGDRVRNYTQAQWESYKSTEGKDANSPTPVDPLFVTAGTNFNLQSISSAINKGVGVGLTQDFEGNPILGFPDIGAFELIERPSPPKNLQRLQ